MKIRYLAHASFHFTPDEGPTVLADPYGPDLGYRLPVEEARYCLVSHDHPDHNHLAAVNGPTTVVNSAGLTRGEGVAFRGTLAEHGPSHEGSPTWTLIFTFQLDGLTICHLGDLGRPLDALQIAEVGAVDILFVPVGGTFTLDAKAARTVVDQLAPRITVPMHYLCAGLRRDTYPLEPLDAFTRGRKDVTIHRDYTMTVTRESLPKAPLTIVMSPKY
jgi:L-ascorbate metabolism protein UlaG (beta-lactamase superfamily)